MRAIISLIAAALFCSPSYAQTGSAKSSSTLNAEVNSLWPDNTTGLITPHNARQTLLDIISSSGTSCTSAFAVGFVGDGSTDNLSAWNTWVGSIGANSACLDFGSGSFMFSGQASATLSAKQTLQVRGSGQDATEVWFSAGNGFNISMNTGTPIGFINSSSITFANLAITTSQSGGVDGLTISGNTTNGYIPRQTNISYVAFRGHVNSGWWRTNISLTDLSDVIISGVGIYGLNNTNTFGTGISYVGTGGGTTPTLININNLTEFFLNTGISASGTWQGLNISQTNIVDVTTGVSCTATALQPECNIYNSQMNASRHSVVWSNMQTSNISNNLFYQGAYTGLVNGDAIISMTTGSNNVIANNSFSAFTLSGATPNCIDMSGGGSPVNNSVISGNTFSGCTTNIIFGTSTNTVAIGNINSTGTPFSGGGAFVAYIGTSIASWPGASLNVGGTTTTAGAVMTAAAPTVSAAQIGYGSTVVANTNCGTLAGSAGCIVVNVAGTTRYIPYY